MLGQKLQKGGGRAGENTRKHTHAQAYALSLCGFQRHMDMGRGSVGSIQNCIFKSSCVSNVQPKTAIDNKVR